MLAESLTPELILLHWISDFIEYILRSLTSKLEDEITAV